MVHHVDFRPAGCPNHQPGGGNARLPRAIARAVHRLFAAHKYAEEAGRSIWEFAITIAELRRDGVSENDLRWLICRGFIEQANEVPSGGAERLFDRRVNLRLCNRSAFVITASGITFTQSLSGGSVPWQRVGVNAIAGDGPELAPATVAMNAQRDPQEEVRPKWDRDRRELRLGGELVKVFKLPSPMQETILMAFEEEHWPPRIDDPLPVHPDMLPKRRLHDTIKSLNRNQKSPLIRFMGDGTGEGVRWESIAAADQKAPISRLG